MDENTEEPVERRTLRDILGAYARDVLHWYSIDDVVADDDLHLGGGGCQKRFPIPMRLL
ncbi:MAG: hypothetical protein JW395_0047 [Nitrospira sp.]|nr:hypothetical protein [Nitrospira sp.]